MSPGCAPRKKILFSCPDYLYCTVTHIGILENMTECVLQICVLQYISQFRTEKLVFHSPLDESNRLALDLDVHIALA